MRGGDWPSSVAKATVTAVLVPVSTASEELGLGVPAMVSLVVAAVRNAQRARLRLVALFT